MVMLILARSIIMIISHISMKKYFNYYINYNFDYYNNNFKIAFIINYQLRFHLAFINRFNFEIFLINLAKTKTIINAIYFRLFFLLSNLIKA